VLDLSALSFCDSAGVHVMIAADRRARQRNRRLTIIPGPPSVQRILKLASVAQPLRLEAQTPPSVVPYR
jgi:anti-anti-sigma regulatory factor